MQSRKPSTESKGRLDVGKMLLVFLLIPYNSDSMQSGVGKEFVQSFQLVSGGKIVEMYANTGWIVCTGLHWSARTSAGCAGFHGIVLNKKQDGEGVSRK